jgi:penicillin-binding protein 2
MILQPIKRKKASEDDSFIGIRLGVLLLFALFLFGVLTFRLWYLQILSGDDYVASATVNRERTVVVEAPRGVIYDHYGEVLVDNRAGLSVGLLPMDMPDPKDEAEALYAELFDLAEVLEMSDADLLEDYERASRDRYMTYVVQEDVAENTVVAYLKENAGDFPGVMVEKTYLRQYPFKALATHLLGYVGEISQADLEQEEFTNLTAGIHVGKDGVERTYDSYLRGTDGFKKVEVNAGGQPIKFTEDRAAEAGFNLYLTIDADLQKAAEDAIVEGIQRAHASGYVNAAGGAVVALDPRNGEVLAMASYPDYDPSMWVGGVSTDMYAELVAPEANNPLFNRAINGLYPAGSTFKPFVATVALQAGVVKSDTQVDCTGSFKVGAQTWKDWTTDGHGSGVNLAQALEQSCDVYFYNLGKILYEQQTAVLQDGLKKFGFSERTGIDLPGETNGSRVPDKVWARERGQEWKTGDEINLAIGQGDLLVTPLQLAVALSALVNSADVNGDGVEEEGIVWVPRLALQITDSSGRIVHPFTSDYHGLLDVAGETEQSAPAALEGGVAPPTSVVSGKETILDRVRRGMRLVVEDPTGTAYDYFWGFPIAVGGKTGTAEKKPDQDYALFMGYAPADDPEIVVVAIIEQGGHGSSVAAPVVRRVMESYFDIEPGVIPGGVTE